MKESRQPPQARGIVRMKDIAEHSNVSLTTVSRLLRGQHAERFTQETRDRVLNAARELGWSPNRLVQSIQTGRTGTVGLVMVPFGDRWQRLMIGLHNELLRCDSLPLALYPDYNLPGTHGIGTELDHLQHLMQRRVDGIICWPLRDEAAIDYLANVCAPQVPVVTLESELPTPSQSVVIRLQEDQAMKEAIDHLVELGHARIGFVGKATSALWATDRRAAFIHQMAEHKLDPVFIEELEKDNRSARKRLDDDLMKVTAVIAGSEQLTISVYHVACMAGLSIPGDLSILAFGQPRLEFAVWPNFTGIDQRSEHIGQTAARMILDDKARKALKSPYVDVYPVLIQGDTTAPPR